MRVHELAKELGVASKDLLLKLKERHIEAKNHMANLDEDVVKLFLEERAKSKSPAAKKQAGDTKTAYKEKKSFGKQEKAQSAKKDEKTAADTFSSSSQLSGAVKKKFILFMKSP